VPYTPNDFCRDLQKILAETYTPNDFYKKELVEERLEKTPNALSNLMHHCTISAYHFAAFTHAGLTTRH